MNIRAVATEVAPRVSYIRSKARDIAWTMYDRYETGSANGRRERWVVNATCKSNGVTI